jgi:hypothetical protein
MNRKQRRAAAAHKPRKVGDVIHATTIAVVDDVGRASRGRPPVPIERDPQRFEIACWWAFIEMGFGKFDAARRALLATKGGPITMEDIEGVLRRASATIPLPQPFDPDDPDKGLRRLSAKAQRTRPTEWLIVSSGLVRGLITFIVNNNMTGICLAFDGLIKLGWGPTILGFVDRIDAALKSNLPPAEIAKLSPAVRRLLADLRPKQKT